MQADVLFCILQHICTKQQQQQQQQFISALFYTQLIII
jgi:hypothetical protein